MRNKKLRSILKKVFGHGDYRFDQLEIINSVLDGKDTLAIMPTGGGKSVCYQVPALYSEGLALVVSPLISLMHDQVINLSETGISACYLNSSLSYKKRRETEEKIVNGDYKLIYVSPEGLLSGGTGEFLRQLDISLIAIDEAHCVSQWGHEFRKDYTRLGELKDLFPNIPRLALTATADSKTREDIINQLRLEEPKEFISSFDRPNIKYIIQERENEISQLNDFIAKNHDDDTGIVYCLSRKKVEQTAQKLKSLGHYAIPYHAGLASEDRENAQEAFNREDNIIIVATIAFGMGIDRPDVRFVAHLDLPKSIESYYQETGRAGRDGKPSTAWMIYGLQDVIKLSQMLEKTEANEMYKKVARFKLDSMLSLCETIHCRRQYILSYFEEESPSKCGSCDSCLYPAEQLDATVDAQKVLSTIFRTGQVFGAGYVVDVLRESKNAKIIERGHHNLSVYGIGKDRSKKYWDLMIRQLLNCKYIGIKNWEYRNLCLTQKSSEILRGEVNFKLRKLAESPTKIRGVKRPSSFDTHSRHDLFEELRKLRKSLAIEKNVPPFVVFSDKSLHDMCQLLPRNKSEFLLVNGVGENKCKKYSDVFLDTIQKFT